MCVCMCVFVWLCCVMVWWFVLFSEYIDNRKQQTNITKIFCSQWWCPGCRAGRVLPYPCACDAITERWNDNKLCWRLIRHIRRVLCLGETVEIPISLLSWNLWRIGRKLCLAINWRSQNAKQNKHQRQRARRKWTIDCMIKEAALIE